MKTDVLTVELQVEIAAEFENLMDFHELTCLEMDKHKYYSVLRGEENEPDDVRKVEIAWANYLSLRDKTNKELVGMLQRNIKKSLFDEDISLRKQLIMLTGLCLYR